MFEKKGSVTHMGEAIEINHASCLVLSESMNPLQLCTVGHPFLFHSSGLSRLVSATHGLGLLATGECQEFNSQSRSLWARA